MEKKHNVLALKESMREESEWTRSVQKVPT
jgi:hypothetical protein